MFDATEYKKAFEPPTFTDLDGTVYVGRLMGADSWFKLQPDLRILTDDATNNARVQRTVFKIIRSMFPRPWWSRWLPIPSTAARKILRLPPILRARAFVDFMHSQDQWIRGRLSPRPGSGPRVETPSSDGKENPSPASTTATV